MHLSSHTMVIHREDYFSAHMSVPGADCAHSLQLLGMPSSHHQPGQCSAHPRLDAGMSTCSCFARDIENSYIDRSGNGRASCPVLLTKESTVMQLVEQHVLESSDPSFGLIN